MSEKSKDIKKNIKKAHKEFKRERRYGDKGLKALVDKNKDLLPYVELSYERYKSDTKEILVNQIISLVFFVLGIVEAMAGFKNYDFMFVLSLFWIFQNRTIQHHRELLSNEIIDADYIRHQTEKDLFLASAIDSLRNGKKVKTKKTRRSNEGKHREDAR